ncbi:hypothetical protein [Pleionea sp. CnH1-48]|uniref:hypothetical protein n=1 Tax=Pleionea sp. CnH1-48 TaxID=2954494 RepID=UPI002096A6A0|nr:hypothetical protein [Pleionea sp. CnH1-48]MCO7226974.1 hypothetical protein [Pleionea sp. CnH1-48]
MKWFLIPVFFLLSGCFLIPKTPIYKTRPGAPKATLEFDVTTQDSVLLVYVYHKQLDCPGGGLINTHLGKYNETTIEFEAGIPTTIVASGHRGSMECNIGYTFVPKQGFNYMLVFKENDSTSCQSSLVMHDKETGGFVSIPNQWHDVCD